MRYTPLSLSRALSATGTYLEGRQVRTGGSGGYLAWQSGARVTGTEKPKTFAAKAA